MSFSNSNYVIVAPHAAKEFAVLPEYVKLPEGITVNPSNGRLYVGTFRVDICDENYIVSINSDGDLVDSLSFGAEPLLALKWGPDDHLYAINLSHLCNAGLPRIQRLSPALNEIRDVALIPTDVGPADPRRINNPDGSETSIFFGNALAGPNEMTFHGNDLYISDSFQGSVYKVENVTNCIGTGTLCNIEVIAHDPLLATSGEGGRPFGANGIVVNKEGTIAWVANTGNNNIVTIDMTQRDPESDLFKVKPFSSSIAGPDGLAMQDDLLWVCANQGDYLAGIRKKDGALVAKLGAYQGLSLDGRPEGLLFPAAITILDYHAYVTNFAFPAGTSVNEPEGDVQRYTISRIRLPRPDEDPISYLESLGN